MKVCDSLAEWREKRASDRFTGQTVGFVPTMGALHDGHRTLLQRAREENARVILSIFVNPTQFDDPNDLVRYPRSLESDLAVAAGLADYVLVPTAKEIYPDSYHYRVSEYELSRRLEGAHRPGHFDGVLTVVLKLLHLVQPRRAYFGEKDWQQLQLVRGMVEALFLPVEIVPCRTVREADGLALSSRNRRLSPAARAVAPQFAKILRASGSAAAAVPALQAAGFEVDYVEDRAGVRLGAVRIEGVRLIDNVRL
ncbi:MAG: pantoate--beta-alanine ligase [Opitutaceae bacterium]|nr:pantoate--beta-alanine ligase [Opitutaceae bacterium]